MSDTPQNDAPDAPESDSPKPVSMAKPSAARPGRPVREQLPNVPLPRTLKAAIAALIGLAVAHGLNILGVSNNKATFTKFFTTNGTAKKAIAKQVAKDITNAKKNHQTPKTAAEYTSQEVAKAVHDMPAGAISQTVLVVAVCALVVYMMVRTRTASSSRWLLLAGFVLTTQPFYIIPSTGYPTGFPPLARISGAAMGIFAIAALVLIFLPESSAYFKACRDLAMPPEMRAQMRPGLFGPRRQPGATAGTGAGQARTTATRPAQTRPASNPAAGKSKAKVRSDNEAIARGAELARSRAKASKSRRTDV